jgi:hypothetical protein
MALTLDFTQDALSVLLAAINYTNGTTITPDQISVQQVAALPSTDISGMNTIAFISSTPDATVFEGREGFKYNRTDISTVPGSRTTAFNLGSAIYLSDLLPQINSAWSLNLTAADIQDGILPGIPSGAQSVSLMMEMASGSLLWINEVEISILASSSDGSDGASSDGAS